MFVCIIGYRNAIIANVIPVGTALVTPVVAKAHTMEDSPTERQWWLHARQHRNRGSEERREHRSKVHRLWVRLIP